MVIVSLITLALLLNAVAIALAFLYVRREVRLTLNAQTRKMRIERKAAAEARKRFDAEIFALQDAFKQAANLMTPDKRAGLLLAPTFRDRMEDRAIADIKRQKQVTVEGVPATGTNN